MTESALPALSVLDLSPVVAGSTARVALQDSIELARRVDPWATRYWVAEHHGMPGIASSSPAVLIGHIAAATSTVRVGSGGVMLPNHAPLVIAEQFGMLEALHPGRIDLGLGRAPGTDQVTAAALRRGLEAATGDDFPQQLGELLAFFNGTFPPSHPYADIRAMPAQGYQPDVWLLGSSGFSAQLAGMLGLPFGFAHHFSAANTLPAIGLYRSRFEASDRLAQPHVMVGVSVVCAGTDDEARELAQPGLLSMLRLRTGRPTAMPTKAEARAHRWTASERAIVDSVESSMIVGSPDTVERRLRELAELTGADELIVTTNVPDFADRAASYDALGAMLKAGQLASV